MPPRRGFFLRPGTRRRSGPFKREWYSAGALARHRQHFPDPSPGAAPSLAGASFWNLADGCEYCAGNNRASYSVVVFRAKGNEMTTTTETLKKAASANARYAADAAEEVAENVSDLANDVSRKAGKQFSRAANVATDAYEEAHEASKEYPHVTLALAAGLGFLLGVIATRR